MDLSSLQSGRLTLILETEIHVIYLTVENANSIFFVFILSKKNGIIFGGLSNLWTENATNFCLLFSCVDQAIKG
jgi:hypothetical protein